MNVLFVNYGDFTTNSLNHVAGFAGALADLGHACAVAVPSGKETLPAVPNPRFLALSFAEALQQPRFFPDGRAADVVHAWTPREGVRGFVLAYQRLAHARLVVHLEDNEEFLLAAWMEHPIENLRDLGERELAERTSAALAHPRRYRHLLRSADAVTVITSTLRSFVPLGVPCEVLEPGVDFSAYKPQVPDAALRAELGLRPNEKVVVFTGSITFANEPEMRELYEAIGLLNARGIATRLVRTGFGSPGFQAALPPELAAHVLDLGFVPKARLPGLLALADALVQPGHPGPFNDYRLPSKLPEFLSAGRPVVLPASNLGRELRDGTDALILGHGTPEEMAAACERIFRDPELARRLGDNAAAFARKRFDLAANTAQLAALYDSIRSQPPRAGATGAMAADDTELTLALRRIAAESADSELGQIAAELVPLVAAMERQEHTQGERLRLERQVAEWQRRQTLTQQHANNLGRELTSTLKRLHLAEETLRLTRQHAANLETQRRGMQRRMRELDAECARIAHQVSIRDQAIGERDDRIAQRQAKIRTMEASLSWRLTLPLRFLRRKLIDPWRPPPAVAAPAPAPAAPAPEPKRELASEPSAPAEPVLFHSVDSPQSWILPPRSTVIRGWCFAEDGRPLTSVRALLPDRVVEGTYGLKRLDVAATARGKPQAEYSGWQLTVDLRPEDTRLDLEVTDGDGKRHAFFHTGLRIGEDLAPPDLTIYEQWIDVYDTCTADMLQTQIEQSAGLTGAPLISVLMPVYNTPEAWLSRAIASVRSQTYPRWELCIADDASTAPHVPALLEKAAAEDSRIRFVRREANGHIAAASNTALEMAHGEYIALLDHDDELAPQALFEVALALRDRPGADYIYSDEDKIDENGRRHEPYFKPDWLPDLFAGQNYTSHLSVYRAERVRAVGGFRPGLEGSQDWDLALRVTEKIPPDRIVHIPKILYHWRAIPGSTALQLSEKNYPVAAARRALADHFERIGQPVEIQPVPGDHWRIKYPLPADPPLVSIVIPTRNGLVFLRRCVDSLLEKTTYPNFEIVVVDNGSDDPDALAYLASLADGSHPLLRPGHAARVLRYTDPFNYSAINNFAVREARGHLVALLNNDLEVISPDWLDEMASQALRPEIGCVGAMLYYPNDTIQHAGVVLGLGGVAGHAFRDFPRGTEGKFNRARLVQNYSAVTAACLLVRKSVYEEAGGLDEKDLAVAFNDIDFCLKVRAAGYRNLWTPFAEFYHHESATRGADDTPEKADRFRREVAVMLERWGPVLKEDPAYNPNLTLEVNDFSLASPPRVSLP